MDELLHRRLVKAIADPGHYAPRGDNHEESIPSWSARAVMLQFEEVHRPSTYKPRPGWQYDPQRRVAWRDGGPGDRETCAGDPQFMARSGGPLIEVPGEVLYRLREDDA